MRFAFGWKRNGGRIHLNGVRSARSGVDNGTIRPTAGRTSKSKQNEQEERVRTNKNENYL